MVQFFPTLCTSLLFALTGLFTLPLASASDQASEVPATAVGASVRVEVDRGVNALGHRVKGLGSGTVVGWDESRGKLLVVTASHVLVQGAPTKVCVRRNGQWNCVPATVLGSDPNGADLAALEFDADRPDPTPISLSDDDEEADPRDTPVCQVGFPAGNGPVCRSGAVLYSHMTSHGKTPNVTARISTTFGDSGSGLFRRRGSGAVLVGVVYGGNYGTVADCTKVGPVRRFLGNLRGQWAPQYQRVDIRVIQPQRIQPYDPPPGVPPKDPRDVSPVPTPAGAVAPPTVPAPNLPEVIRPVQPPEAPRTTSPVPFPTHSGVPPTAFRPGPWVSAPLPAYGPSYGQGNCAGGSCGPTPSLRSRGGIFGGRR